MSEIERAEPEPTYRVTYLTGEMKLKPIQHCATWTSHDLLDIKSDIMTFTNFEAQFLYMLDNVTFTNERPTKPRRGFLAWLFGTPSQDTER